MGAVAVLLQFAVAVLPRFAPLPTLSLEPDANSVPTIRTLSYSLNRRSASANSSRVSTLSKVAESNRANSSASTTA